MKKLNLEEKHVSEIFNESDLVNDFGGSGSGSGSRGSGSGSRGSGSGSKGSGSSSPTSGSLTSNGQEAVGTSFFAPYGASFVRFTCVANAALTPGFTCGTRSLGGWQYKTKVGTLFSATTIDVPLYSSNDHIAISFQTTDSNGGTCSWELMF